MTEREKFEKWFLGAYLLSAPDALARTFTHTQIAALIPCETKTPGQQCRR